MADTTRELMEERIRQRAYRLWQEDGSPEGRADDYWYRAARQIAAEGDDSAYPEPTVEQSDKQQFEARVPEESPDDQSATDSEPRAKRRRT
jgi:hypothetical protein